MTSKSPFEINWPLARPVLFLFSLFTVIKTPTTHCIHSRIGLCYLSYIRGSLPLLHSYIVDRGGLKEIWARLNIWVWVLISEHFQNGHLHRKIGSSTSLRSAQRWISIISCPVQFLTFFLSMSSKLNVASESHFRNWFKKENDIQIQICACSF